MALTRAGATMLRLEPVELRDRQHAGGVDPDRSVHMFAPGYLGVAAVAGGLHFIPLPQPWGLLTYVVFSLLFGLAAFHLGFAVLRRFIRSGVTTHAQDTVASVLGVLTCLAALVLFSFLAPGPLDLLYR